MYRTSSHEPRYRRSTRKGRHAESREASENSTSEDEEESSESGTEESETLESRGSESVLKDSLCSTESSYYQRKRFNKNITDSFMTSHVCKLKVSKHDKNTQKNFLSPFPSFTIPPIYRELEAYKGQSGRSNKEKHVQTVNTGLRRPPKHSSRRQESDDEGEDSVCYIHKSTKEKGYDRYRGEKDHGSRKFRPERVLTCVNTDKVVDPSGKCTVEKPSKIPTLALPPVVPLQRPKTADGTREKATSDKCQESGGRSGRRSAGISSPFVEDQSGEAASAKGKRNRKASADENGEVKEKLVYVVQEKGKDVSKVETDLFTLNEILTIKKDLLELSEFAKKLKKLKEMRREVQTGANLQTPCQCQPAAELLKDVNRRIEALEARQAELERGSKSEKKGCREKKEKDLKKSASGKKTSLESQSVAVKTSAVTTTPNSPKTETFVSRTENFSNNSDIVNELMDIKAQLQKLEEKRLSKAVLETPPPAEDSKRPTKEEHAIAVFSSRTYILTENFDKRKAEIKVLDEEKVNNYCYTVEEENDPGKEERKEQVANWLRNVSPKSQENAYLPPNPPQRDDNVQKEGEWTKDFRCKNCLQALTVQDVQNQEPQKNRATGKDGRSKSDLGFADAKKNDCPGKQMTKYKECIVTPSGKVFACVNCSSGGISVDCPGEDKPKTVQQTSSLQPLPQAKETNEVSVSIPTTIMVKECIRKLKTDLPRRRHFCGVLPRIINSKSLEQVSVNSSKTEKTLRNTNLKNMDKMEQQKEKKHKEGKNQCLKLLEAHLSALRKTLKRDRDSTTTSSHTRSEFLASINLDTGTSSEASKLQGSGDNKTLVMTYNAAIEPEETYLDDCLEEKKKSAKAEEKRRKWRELECKKSLKRKLKQQKQLESAERKRKQQQQKCEIKQLKQRCKELKYGLSIEESVPEKKSKSLENNTPVKRSVDVGTAKKCKSSEETLPKKSQGNDECKKSRCSEEFVCKKKQRPVEEQQKKCYREPASCSKHRRCEDEQAPRTCRYREEAYDERYREDPPRRPYEWEDVPRRYYERENVPRRYYEREDVPRRYYEREDVPWWYYERENLPRRQYDREEIPRRLYENEEVPRIHRYEEENDSAQRWKEKYPPPRKSYGKDESVGRQRFDGCYIPKKFVCEPVPSKPSQKFSGEEGYQRTSEEPTEVFKCFKSEDSLKVFKDRHEEKVRKSNYKVNQQPSESCKLKNIMKSIGMLKLNLPIAQEFCDGKHEKCKKRKTAEKQKREKEREGSDDDKIQWTLTQSFFDEDNDDDYDDCNRTYSAHYSRTDLNAHPYIDQKTQYSHHQQQEQQQKQQQHQQQQHQHHHHSERPALQGNCRCFRVFLQSQEQKGWSGLGPFRKITSDSATEESSSKTDERHKSSKNSFGLPRAKPAVFQVGYSCPNKSPDKCQEKYDKCICKCKKKREKCEAKREKKRQKKNKKKCKCRKGDDDCCKCKKCRQPRECCKKVRTSCAPKPCAPPPCAPPPCVPPPCAPPPCVPPPCAPPPCAPPPCVPKEPVKSQESTPFISFLSQLCKPREPKNGKFLKKLDEVRYLKMCNSTEGKPIRGQNLSKPCNMSSNDQKCNKKCKCTCTSKLIEIESRLCFLESTKQECSDQCRKEKHKKCYDNEARGRECSECRRKESNDCKEKECNECCRKESNDCKKKECNECCRKESNDCKEKECNECCRKESNDCKEKECNECCRKESNDCKEKECNECERGCGKCPKKKCKKCKKKKKKKKKCCCAECCTLSDCEESRKKKRKKQKPCCCECQRGELPCEQGGKCPELRPKPCEIPTYYQTIYCDNNKNNSSFSGTSKSSTVDEKDSTESTKSKEEPLQTGPQEKEGLSSLHSFWKNLRRYSINHSRNGVETLMKKIRGKRSSCTLEPDISVVNDCPIAGLREAAVMESSNCRRRKNKAGEMKREKRERKNPERQPRRKRYE